MPEYTELKDGGKCEACEEGRANPVPGVLVTEVRAEESDSGSRLEVQRCDLCARYDGDDEALVALAGAFNREI